MNSPQLLERVGRPAGPSAGPDPTAHQSLVRAWMSAPVAAATVTTPIPDAYNLMVQRRIRHLPVVEGDRVVGLVTRSALREVLPLPALLHSSRALRVGMGQLLVGLVMAPDPPTVTPSTPVQEAAALMLAQRVDAVPVVGLAGDLLGILTATDLCRMIAAGAEARYDCIEAPECVVARQTPERPRRAICADFAHPGRRPGYFPVARLEESPGRAGRHSGIIRKVAAPPCQPHRDFA